MGLEVHQIACLSDNYGFLVHDPVNNVTASIDSPEAGPINEALQEKAGNSHTFSIPITILIMPVVMKR